jgi:hypothetical protein
MADHPPKLTDQQRRFVEEYAARPVASRAYRIAFPDAAPNSVRTLAARLLAKVHIRRAVKAAQRAQARRCRTDADRINRELAAVAFADPADAFDPDPTGGPCLPRRLHDIPADARRAIQSVKVKRRRIAGGGDEVYEVEEVEYKFAPKLDALDKLGKRLGLDAAGPAGGGVIQVEGNGRDRPGGET